MPRGKRVEWTTPQDLFAEGDDDRYERAHKNRAGVLKAGDREAGIA